jgi:hypothetical protein
VDLPVEYGERAARQKMVRHIGKIHNKNLKDNIMFQIGRHVPVCILAKLHVLCMCEPHHCPKHFAV